MLKRFFEEKELQEVVWEIETSQGWNIISSTKVIEWILSLEEGEQKEKIKQKIREIDFQNGNINNFLKHIAKWLVTA